MTLRETENRIRMKIVKGQYSSTGPRNTRGLKADSRTLIDYCSARGAGIRLHGSRDATEEFATDAQARKIAALQARRSAAPLYVASFMHRPPEMEPEDRKSANPFRFVAISRVPWLDRGSQQVEWGRYCIGCPNLSPRDPAYEQRVRQMYTPKSFNEHVKDFGRVEILYPDIGFGPAGRHVLD